MKKYKITNKDGSIEVKGEPLNYKGIKLFVFYDNELEKWNVTETSTGFRVAIVDNKEMAIKAAELKIDDFAINLLKEYISSKGKV